MENAMLARMSDEDATARTNNTFLPEGLGSKARALLALAPMNAKLLEIQYPTGPGPKEDVVITRPGLTTPSRS